MRTVNVKINDDKTVDITKDTVGYVEESNATQLIISLNTELQAEDIAYHVVCFRHGENDEKLVSERLYQLEDPETEPDTYRLGDEIRIALPQYVTKYPNIYVQIEGYILAKDAETGEEYINRIIKSPVFFVKLDDSIVGDEGEFNSEVEGIFADLQDMASRLAAVMPAVEVLEQGITWDDIGGYSKPSMETGLGYGSVTIGPKGANSAEGNYSVTIGTNLVTRGEYGVLVGKYGRLIDGMLFGVANGTEESSKLAFEVGPADATFYVTLLGMTPALTAPPHTIPTIKWIKDYLDAYVYPKYDGDITTLISDVSALKTELPEGLDQVSNEVLEVRDSLTEQIYINKPYVSDVLVLLANGWTLNENGKYTQSVVVGVDTLKRNEIDVEIASSEEWGRCFVLAVSESGNGIVFEANDLPTENLSFRITSTEVNYAV